MTSRIEISNSIANILAIFSRKLEILGANNELSWHTYAENIMVPILNLVFDLNLVNSNIELSRQVVAIDLVDEEKGVAFQLTSDDSFSKIKGTLTKFLENKLHERYEILNVVFLKEKGKRTLSRQQENELFDLTRGRIKFNVEDNLFDFSRLYMLTHNKDILDIEEVASKLQNELGRLSEDSRNIGPVIILIFDEDSDFDFAEKILEGLIELGIRVRHFSPKLDYIFKKRRGDSDFCRILYDINKDYRTIIILGTNRLKSRLKLNSIDSLVVKTLQDQHNLNYLFKLEENVSFSDLSLYKPQVFKASKANFQSVIDTVVLELRKQNIVSEVKGYDDFSTIVRLYETKAELSEVVDFVNYRKKIGYSFLEAIDRLKSHKTSYVFLYKGISVKPTSESFFKNHADLKSRRENSFIVILPKETQQKQLEDRIITVQRAFRTKTVFYLDEFIWDHCTTGFSRKKEKVQFSYTKNYITPELKTIEGSISDFDQIENWVTSEHDPILVITGGGGIGKSTMARIIADKFQTIRANSSVIFIEASDGTVINGLLKISEGRQIDLYDFYTVAFPYDTISRDLFRINIDNGNFLLIIDGLDEVFSRIPDFNVKHFITGVSTDFVKDIGVGKVLLTCRSYFWKDMISKDTHVNHFEIEPFSRDHARMFFESKFGDDEKNVDKSMAIIDSLNHKISEEKDKILPYIVDVVGKIVESGDSQLAGEAVSDRYLNLHQKNDYVIYQLLVREFRKTAQLTVEQQSKFFIFFSVYYGGRISSDELPLVWSNHFGSALPVNAINALRSHPLLEEQSGSLIFKYDFFEIFFKSLYLAEIITPNSSEIPSNNLLKILLNEGKFASSLFYETANRTFLQWSEDYVLRISLLLESVKKVLVSNQEFNVKSSHQAISSLFALALMINQQKFNSNTNTNTKLLLDLFGNSRGEVTNLSLVNFSKHQSNIKFDFTGLSFVDCYFEAYDSFWDCIFKDTSFESCGFFNMPSFQTTNSKEIRISMFSNSRNDLTFSEYFESINEKFLNKSEQLKMALSKFFGMFYSSGYLQPQGVDSILRKRYNSRLNKIVSLDLILSVLEKQGLIEFEYSKITKEKRAFITDRFKEDIIQYTKEDTMSMSIKRILDSIIN